MEAKTAEFVVSLEHRRAHDIDQGDLLAIPGPLSPMVFARVNHVVDGGKNQAGVTTVQFQCSTTDEDGNRFAYMVWRSPHEWMTVVSMRTVDLD